eukprot:m.225865 g.225865  ORF g.225865 m.225865 type:complete len:85 (+) comp16817_c0_seq1:205-459(+)
MDVVKKKITKLQEEIDAAGQRAGLAERALKEQEHLNMRLEAELKAKDAHIAELESKLAQETRKRKEVEVNLAALQKEIESLGSL